MKSVMSKDGTAIAFEQEGKGTPLILVGGALDSGTQSFALFSQLASLLSRQFTVLTYDRRGRGNSSDTLPYRVEREIEDVDALVKEVGGSVSLFGFSSGAALALRTAAQLGNAKVEKLALYEPPYSSGESAKEEFARYSKNINELLESNKHEDAVVLFLSDMLSPDILETMRESPEWSKLEKLAPTLAYDNAVLGDSLVPVATAKAITMPTLLLNGSATLDFMREAVDTLAKAIPHASRETLEGQDHGVTAKALAPVLAKFFNNEEGKE